MPEISTGTLVMCIQAVAAEIRAMQAAVQSGEAELDDFQILQDWSDAADDLEAAYDAAAKTQLNLPPYDELISG
ncbi:MAG: hypothetical protein HYZ45_07500 [Burkholderiales bacterium]|nr:hypothetical protein [Burkholderiales bacterium]